MPEMDGYQTAQWIRQHLPDTKIIALSMYENDYAIIQMLKNGCHGYLLKNSEPMLLYTAFNEIKKYGYFSNDMVSDKLIHYIGDESALKKQQDQVNQLTEKEKAFMGLVCTDKTYKEIADIMFISPRTVDTYRDHLFKKLDIKTRVGLALFAIKNNLAEL
jgi:DNA-binding NarL/FixJ family response regulator